jgi:hypothetical protein
MEGYKQASKHEAEGRRSAFASIKAAAMICAQRERERSGSRARNDENPCARRRVAREGEAEEEEEKQSGQKNNDPKKKKKKKAILPFAFILMLK